MGIVVSLLIASAIGVLSFGYKTKREVALGGALGVLGASVILGALGFCPFVNDAESTEGVLGVALAGSFAWIFGAGTRAVFNQKAADLGSGDIRTGSFKLGWYWPWLLLSPTLVILVFFLYLPAYRTFTLSTKLTRLGTPKVAERCLSNFSDLLVTSPTVVVLLPLTALAIIWGVGMWHRRSEPGTLAHDFTRVIRPFGILVFMFAIYFIFENQNGGYRQIYLNTVIISSSIVVISMVLGLALAYLTFRHVRGIAAYRTLLIWPYAISPPVAGILFFMMFDATGGIFSAVADNWFGFDFPNYALNATTARSAIILASVWKLLGYNLLFFLAGLQTVPREQIEAAAIDGANSLQRFRKIVMPALGPIAFFLLITNLTYSFFDVYGTIDFLTKGAPAGATSVSIYEIIRVGVDNGDLGRGAAQSVVLFLAVIALTAWQFRQSEGRISYASA